MKRIISTLLALMLMLGCVSLAAAEDAVGWINEDTAVRMTPSDAAVQSGSLKAGTRVAVLQEARDESGAFSWYRVQESKENLTGWVHAQVVDVVSGTPAAAAPAATAAPMQNGTPVINEADWPVLTASGVLSAEEIVTDLDVMRYTEIKIGDKGDAVRPLFNRLNELGYSNSGSKVYDAKIEKFIRQFQQVNGLEEDGIVSPRLQAIMNSPAALKKDGKPVGNGDPMLFKTAKNKSKKGTDLSMRMVNKTGKTIDAFRVSLIFYDAYGKRYCFTDSVMDEVDMLVFSVESGKVNKGKEIELRGSVSDTMYFAGGYVSLVSYHTADGETVDIPLDERHWFGFGKGVTEGYVERKVVVLTEGEKELAESWKLGVSGLYVDEEYAKEYKLREGYLVVEMDPNTPVDAAGLRAGDVILAIGNYRIFGSSSLLRARAHIQAGESVPMLYWRNGTVYVTTLTRPGEVGEI